MLGRCVWNVREGTSPTSETVNGQIADIGLCGWGEWMRRYRVPKGRPLVKVDTLDLVRSRASGLSCQEVAQAYGMKPATVSERVRFFRRKVLSRATAEGCGVVWRGEAERLLDSSLIGCQTRVGLLHHPVWPVLVDLYKRGVKR